MLISVYSAFTNDIKTMRIPGVSQEEVNNWVEDPNAPLIQDAFPNLSPPEREFIMTGITPDEWDDLFFDEEDEDGDEEPPFR